MPKQARAIRSQIERIARGRKSQSRRYPQALRDAAVAYAREHLGAGESRESTARALGLDAQTLSNWIRAATGSTEAQPALREVTVLPARAPGRSKASRTTPVLITAQGWRIEGLDVDTLVELVRRCG